MKTFQNTYVTNFHLIKPATIIRIRATTVVSIIVLIGECENVEGNIHLLAKESKQCQLIQSVCHVGVHRPRPINKHHKPMILSISDNIVPKEQIFRELICMEFIGIKNTSPCNFGPLMFISRLAHFKFFC